MSDLPDLAAPKCRYGLGFARKEPSRVSECPRITLERRWPASRPVALTSPATEHPAIGRMPPLSVDDVEVPGTVDALQRRWFEAHVVEDHACLGGDR